jgi:hypothetical protein
VVYFYEVEKRGGNWFWDPGKWRFLAERVSIEDGNAVAYGLGERIHIFPKGKWESIVRRGGPYHQPSEVIADPKVPIELKEGLSARYFRAAGNKG